MNIRKTVLAAAIAAFAFAALPALASATPKLDFAGSTHFTVTGGTAQLTSHEDTVHCESVTGTGEFENGQTGTIEFSFHGCKESLGFNCTSSGQPTGTITTQKLDFHLVTLTGDETPGVLITPNTESGIFAKFACFIIGVTVGGNGIIGELTQPGYGEETDSFTVDFECASPTAQVHTEVDDEGYENPFGLESSLGPEPACEDASGTGTFTNGDKAKLTHG